MDGKQRKPRITPPIGGVGRWSYAVCMSWPSPLSCGVVGRLAVTALLVLVASDVRSVLVVADRMCSAMQVFGGPHRGLCGSRLTTALQLLCRTRNRRSIDDDALENARMLYQTAVYRLSARVKLAKKHIGGSADDNRMTSDRSTQVTAGKIDHVKYIRPSPADKVTIRHQDKLRVSTPRDPARHRSRRRFVTGNTDHAISVHDTASLPADRAGDAAVDDPAAATVPNSVSSRRQLKAVRSMTSPFIGKHEALNFVRDRRIGHRMRRGSDLNEAGSRSIATGIICECCVHRCTVDELVSYCTPLDYRRRQQ